MAYYTLNALAVARQHLGSLDRVKRVVRLGGHFGRFRRTAESRGRCFGVAADVFGKDKSSCRLVYGVASLPLGTPVELEVIFEIAG